MSKLKQNFEITYPLNQNVTRNYKNVIDHVGDLVVTGTAYCDPSVMKTKYSDRYSMDIDFILWNGTDIRPVLEVVGGLDEIEEFCFQKASSLFNEERRVA